MEQPRPALPTRAKRSSANEAHRLGPDAAVDLPQGLHDLAAGAGPDVLAAACRHDPTSSRHAQFVSSDVPDGPSRTLRVPRRGSLLERIDRQAGPVVVNDLRQPRSAEERALHDLGMRALVAIPVAIPQWTPGAIVFACRSVRRFDALTVGALLDSVEAWASREVVAAAPEDGTDAVQETEVGEETVVGESAEFLEICRLIAVVAKRDTTVLIQGESGTGKELLARTIHRYSPRGDRPFVRVNCAALAESLIESEMFGHRKGAFTGAIDTHKGRFQVADGGTLLLDEIGNMSLAGQAKLLRVLQEREFEPVGQSAPIKVDVRIIATTNVDLEKAIRRGGFREDLYYRLAVVPINVPPLRRRHRDILPLAEHFLRETARKRGQKAPELSGEARALLAGHDWPGNAREMRNAMEYACVVARGAAIEIADLPRSIRGDDDDGNGKPSLSLRERMTRYERELVLDAVQRAGGVRKEIARLLDIDPRNVSYFLKKHGLR
jgi:transcriptional regulator with GAF, ATPase, and Fis domain